MAKLNTLILKALADQVFIPERVKTLLREQTKRLENARGSFSEDLSRLAEELQNLEAKKNRLYEAVEGGYIPLDDSLRERVRQHDTKRQELLARMATLRQRQDTSPDRIGDKEVKAFCTALREHLVEDAAFAKAYLRILVDEITLSSKTAVLKGNCEALGKLVQTKNLGTPPARSDVPRLALHGEPCRDRTFDHRIKS